MTKYKWVVINKNIINGEGFNRFTNGRWKTALQNYIYMQIILFNNNWYFKHWYSFFEVWMNIVNCEMWSILWLSVGNCWEILKPPLKFEALIQELVVCSFSLYFSWNMYFYWIATNEMGVTAFFSFLVSPIFVTNAN